MLRYNYVDCVLAMYELVNDSVCPCYISKVGGLKAKRIYAYAEKR